MSGAEDGQTIADLARAFESGLAGAPLDMRLVAERIVNAIADEFGDAEMPGEMLAEACLRAAAICTMMNSLPGQQMHNMGLAARLMLRIGGEVGFRQGVAEKRVLQ